MSPDVTRPAATHEGADGAAATFAARLSDGASGDTTNTFAGGLFSGGSGLPIPLPFLVIGGGWSSC